MTIKDRALTHRAQKSLMVNSHVNVFLFELANVNALFVWCVARSRPFPIFIININK